MVKSCAAFNCKNNGSKNGDKSFFRFPLKDEQRLRKWCIQIRRANFVPNVNSRLCSDHFAEDCFIVKPNSKSTHLKPGSVPTLFSFLPKKGRGRTKLPTSPGEIYGYDDEEWKLRNEKGPKRQKFVDRLTSPGSSVTSTEEATEGELIAPEILCKSKVKVEYDDGSYDDHKGGDKNYSDVIPSALCEAVINPEKRLQNRNEEVILPEQDINTSARPGENNSSDKRIVFGAILPTMSGNPVTDHTGEFRSAPVIPVNSLGTVADKPFAGSAEVTPSTSDEHPLETFFRSMARTVLKFPPHLIAEARMKVCALVSEMEIRALKESYSLKGQLS